uniref:Uncharacterized protein n=1 Tax=Panagrolaimus superbus TaxID=310955 RepID=A0A914YD03_9BILA
MPNLQNAIYGEAENTKPNNRELPPPPDSINDISSGYMNSSYEAIGGDNFKNNSKQKSRKIVKNSQPSSRASQRPKSQAQESQSDYSSVTTKSLGTNTSNDSVGAGAAPLPPSRLRPPINSTYKKKILVNRSVSPIRRISDEGFSEEDEVSRQYSKMRTKSLEPKTQSLAEQRLSQAAMEQLKKEAKNIKFQKNVENEKQQQPFDNGEYLEYIKTERKSSIKNKTSLISFDPKSNSNTLLRVHEHIDEDDDDNNGGGEEEWATTRSADDANNGYKEVIDCGIKMRAKRTTSQDSVPSIQAPTLSMCHTSNNLDSGHPSSNSAEQSMSPDWSHAGIYHVTQRPTMSPPLPPINNKNDKNTDKSHKIIGYELAGDNKYVPNYQQQHLSGYPPPISSVSNGTAFSSFPSNQNSLQNHENELSQGISLSAAAAIPLLNSFPIQQTSSSSTRFLAQPPSMPDYAIPSDSNNHYFSPDDFGLKLRSPTSPIIGYESQTTNNHESTKFDSKPPPTAPIILCNQGLLV